MHTTNKAKEKRWRECDVEFTDFGTRLRPDLQMSFCFKDKVVHISDKKSSSRLFSVFEKWKPFHMGPAPHHVCLVEKVCRSMTFVPFESRERYVWF